VERKRFLKTSLCLGAVCGLRPVLGAEGMPEQAPAPDGTCAGAMAFARHWVKDLIDQADAQLTEAQRKALLEARGRSCARGGAAAHAARFEGRLHEFIVDMQSHLGPDAVRREGDLVQVTYSQCLCPLVAKMQEPLSPSYCFCSAGWLKEVFATVSGQPVTVEILETVKRGGQRCRFDVRLGA
jgi:hypothetical protein